MEHKSDTKEINLNTIKYESLEDIKLCITQCIDQVKDKSSVCREIISFLENKGFPDSQMPESKILYTAALSIVVADIERQMDHNNREENMKKIDKICKQMDINSNFVTNISIFSERFANLHFPNCIMN